MFEKINIYYFLISFCIGILYINLNKPKPQIIYKFPTKYNVGKVIYESDSGNCYNYSVQEEKCPLDKKNIKEHPFEEFQNKKNT